MDIINKITLPHERISTWLKSEMEIAGSKDLPINIDTDIEDDDDPFGPQPKRFLLTNEERKRFGKEFEDRKVVHTIRKYRKAEIQKRRQIRKQRRAFRRSKRSLASLPNDLILEVIRHTRPDDLVNFLGSGEIARRVFADNKGAVFRGIEATQFSEMEWVFGSGRRRSDEQKQALKDLLATYLMQSSTTSDLSGLYDKIDKGEFLDWSSIFYLQATENLITDDVQRRMSNGFDMTRRSALCFRIFSSLRHHIEDHSEGKNSMPDEVEQIIVTEAMPLEARIKLFEKQPAATQAEIRHVLETEIMRIIGYLDEWPLQPGGLGESSLMGRKTRDWIDSYYSPERFDRKMKPERMGVWIARLAAGYILDTLLPAHPSRAAYLQLIAGQIREDNLSFRDALDEELRESGSTDGWWKESREFAERIGLDMGRVLKDSPVEEYLDKLS